MNTESEVRSLAIDLMTKHGLIAEGWTFGFSRQKTGHGLCSYRSRTIKLSRFSAFSDPIEEIKDTILHEISHAKNPFCYHNWKWKSYCISIGGSGRVTKDFVSSVIPAKYEAKCACTTHKAYRLIKRRMLCRRCRTPLVFVPTGY